MDNRSTRPAKTSRSKGKVGGLKHFPAVETLFIILTIGHFTVVGLVPEPLIEREAEVDLVLIQTSFFYNVNFA